jgi:hypothetical protein
MKTTMKFFAAITIMLGFAVTTFGQAQADGGTIAGNALVVDQVVVTGTQSLEFSNVTPGVLKRISAAGAVVAGVAGGAQLETEGKFSVTKGVNSQVTLSWTLPTELAKTSLPTATMGISFADYSAGTTKFATVDVLGALTPFTPSNTVPTTISSAAFNAAFAANSFVVHLGGEVSPVTGQTPGAYTANITLTATYN